MLEQQMKRAISIFFILLANIAILAHAVVPHHHHNKVFAAIVNVLDDDAQKALKDNSYDSGSFDFDYQFDLFSADIVVGTVASELLGSLPFVPKPYIAGSHLDYVARAIGLRAPPIC